MRTQVVIVGAGPAGLILSQLLHNDHIESIILEKHDRAYVEGRIRAGVLEPSTVDVLRSAGAGERIDRDGLAHRGFYLSDGSSLIHIDLHGLTGGKHMTVYGQSEMVKDLIAIIVGRGGELVFDAGKVRIDGLQTDRPRVSYSKNGVDHQIDCDFVAGCDGFHGVSRSCIPAGALQIFERSIPCAWLGILADVPPCSDEIIYASHERGFALASMRSRTRSRYYIQCPLDQRPEQWADEQIWDELAARLGHSEGGHIARGPLLEKSIAPLRSFVAEPMSHGRLFIAGDAAHIVPPTGAKGLNLAAGDAYLLSCAVAAYYRFGDRSGLQAYSARALARVWKAERFSWWITSLTHRLSADDAFTRRLQLAELDYLRGSRAAQSALAENYAGLALA